MNNSTINFNQEHIDHNFESPVAIHQVACWLLSSKIQLVLSSKNFPQTFSPDHLENSFVIQSIFKEQKRWKSLGTRSGEYVVWNRKDQSKSNFFLCRIQVECSFVLSWKESQHFYWLVWGIFREDFNEHIAAVESISLHWMSGYSLKIKNE